MREQQTGTSTAFLSGLVLGMVVGAAAATLLAPAPGERTRQQLADRSRELQQRMERMARDMQESLGDLATRFQPSARPTPSGAHEAGPEERTSNN